MAGPSETILLRIAFIEIGSYFSLQYLVYSLLESLVTSLEVCTYVRAVLDRLDMSCISNE